MVDALALCIQYEDNADSLDNADSFVGIASILITSMN